MTTFEQSKACCTIPPIDPTKIDYTPQGSYEEIAGLKTCKHTSPSQVMLSKLTPIEMSLAIDP